MRLQRVSVRLLSRKVSSASVSGGAVVGAGKQSVPGTEQPTVSNMQQQWAEGHFDARVNHLKHY